ncbi:MAG: PQQ-binding-like beta-propeller repeat protein [Planctomycetaceae bacterium]
MVSHLNKSLCISVVLTLLCTDNLSAQFQNAGGDAQRSGFVQVDGPLKEPEILWEHNLGVIGISDTQPVIDVDGNIYVTGCPVNQKTWEEDFDPIGTLVSLSPEGEVNWRYDWTWNKNQQNTWSQLTGPILVGKDLVAMGSRFGWLRCWNRHTGDMLWERRLTAGTDPITSTPIADSEGNIYVHVRDIPTLRKIDSRTGQYIWVHKFIDDSIGNTSSPTLSHDQKTVYIGRTARDIGYLYAIDTVEGNCRWAWSPEVSKGHSFAWNIPIVDQQGTVYIQDEEFANLYAVHDLGKVHAFKWSYKKEGRGVPRVGAVDNEAIYSCFNQPQPFLFAVDLNGQEKWSRSFSEGRGIAGLVVGNKAVYFGMSGTGQVIAVNKQTGEVLWAKQVGTANSSFSEGLSLGADGTLYVPVNGTPSHPKMAFIIALKSNE